MTAPRRTVLCITSYFKGNRLIQRVKREGARVYLLTLEKLRDEPWARDHLDDVYLMPSLEDTRSVINAVAYLMRTIRFDVILSLDEFDMELAATLREHFRLPGMGESAVRLFRDKLAMRVRAREAGIAVPEFTGILHHDDVRHFLAQTPAPWLLKPRTEASAMGIQKFHHADDVWRKIDELGDAQSFHLIERFIPGSLYHVDALASGGKVVFNEVSQYYRPLLEIWQGGGVFSTRTVARDRPEVRQLREMNAAVLTSFGLSEGVSHSEFMKANDTGALYFIETSARVGGASISDVVEAATGINLWEEWGRIELGGPYVLPPTRQEYGGAVVSLARDDWPDTSPFTDPEIFYRLVQKYHIGLVVRAPTPERVEELLTSYRERIARDYQKVLPPTDRAGLA